MCSNIFAIIVRSKWNIASHIFNNWLYNSSNHSYFFALILLKENPSFKLPLTTTPLTWIELLIPGQYTTRKYLYSRSKCMRAVLCSRTFLFGKTISQENILYSCSWILSGLYGLCLHFWPFSQNFSNKRSLLPPPSITDDRAQIATVMHSFYRNVYPATYIIEQETIGRDV